MSKGEVMMQYNQLNDRLHKSGDVFYKMFFEHAAVMLLVDPLTGDIIDANKSAIDFYGYDFCKEKMLKISDINILSAEDIKKEMELAVSQKRNSFIFRHKLANGDIRTVEVNSTPVEIDKSTVLFSIINDITDRYFAEEALRRSEAVNKAIVETVPDLIFRISNSGVFLDSPTRNENALLLPKDSFLGKRLDQVLPKDVALKSLAALNEVLQTHKEVKFEYSLHIDQEIRYFENRMMVISDEEVLSMVRDISDRRKSEVELQDVVRNLSTLIQNLQAGTLFENHERRITLVNQSFCNIFGIPLAPDQMLGFDCALASEQSKFLMSDPDGFIKRIEEVLENCEIVLNDELYLKDGRVLARDYIPIKQADELLGHLWQYRDITLKKKAETALFMQNAAFESFGFAIIITDIAGSISWANHAFTSLTGYTVEEAIGKNSGELLSSGEQNQLFYQDLWQTILQKKVWNGELINRRKDGTIYYEEETITPIIDANGTISGFIALKADITDRKRASEFESVLLQLSLQLTGIPATELEQSLNKAVGRIGEFLDADRAYVFEFSEDKVLMSNTLEWCNDGINPEIDNLKDIPCEIFPEWMSTLNRFECILIESVSNLPENWKYEREILEPQGIKSLIVVPLLLENELIGFFGLDSVVKNRIYNTSEINILKVWANMLTVLINYRRKESIIEHMRINYETFFNTIDEFLFVLNEENKVVHANDAVFRRLGYSRQEISGMLFQYLHPREERNNAELIMNEMLSGEIESCQIPLISKSGVRIPVESKIKKGFWDGNPAIFGVSKDITSIKLSEEKFAKAFHTNAASMGITDLEGRFIDVNDTFLLINDYSIKEVIGHTANELGVFVDHQIQNQIITMLKQHSSIRDLEVKTKTKSGNLRTGLFSADIVAIGSEPCVLTMYVDITERKLAEAALIDARNEAVRVNRAKSEFLSRMSHELRTPMNSILGFAQLLEMSDLNLRQSKGVSHIINSGNHLLNLINEVLDISGIESGRQVLKTEPLDVNFVIAEVLSSVELLAHKRKISLEFIESSPQELKVFADNIRLKQVLINLINNAIKYNAEGGKVQVVAQHVVNQDNDAFVKIAVIDNGPGIAADDLEKLFQPFERIGAANSEIEGTGLGLMVVQKLIEAMQGRIGVESVPGEGTTFWFELPETNQYSLHESNNESDGNVPGADTGRCSKLLYIEDNKSNLELVEDILSDYRSSVQMITSRYGKETLPLAKEHKPALILLDLNLPDIHGLDVLNELHADPATKKIPVVIISADAMPRQIKKLMKAGADEYLTKPLDIKFFLKIIDKYII